MKSSSSSSISEAIGVYFSLANLLTAAASPTRTRRAIGLDGGWQFGKAKNRINMVVEFLEQSLKFLKINSDPFLCF